MDKRMTEKGKDLFEITKKLQKVFEDLYLKCNNPPTLPEKRIVLPLNYKKEKGE
jgi:hypothetical protein